MTNNQHNPSTNDRPEIVLGLVAPTGVDRTSIISAITDHMVKFGYKTEHCQLSSLLPKITEHGIPIIPKPFFNRVMSLMDAGDMLRKKLHRGDALVLYSIADTIEDRKKTSGGVLPNTIRIIDSLKHPDEVRTLRKIYGPGFFLIGINASEERRRDYLVDHKSVSKTDATKLIDRDKSGGEQLGQRMGDTFELADAYISLDEREHDAHSHQIWRILDLLFGDPFCTPTSDEHAMFLAYASSLRSADLSRQVGAVITSGKGEVIATGANEVPKAGGGQYITTSLSDDLHEDPNDHRDFRLGEDSNAKRRQEIVNAIREVVQRLSGKKNTNNETINQDIQNALESTDLFRITEFGRPVHAEMEALLACARIGVSPIEGTLYTTTFPCHNCAKHIVDAGIARVVFVEPYPKSLALELHNDSVVLGPVSNESEKNRVVFEPFTGVAARRYVDLFSIRLSSGEPIDRKDGNIMRKKWLPNKAEPRLQLSALSYLEREKLFVNEIK